MCWTRSGSGILNVLGHNGHIPHPLTDAPRALLAVNSVLCWELRVMDGPHVGW